MDFILDSRECKETQMLFKQYFPGLRVEALDVGDIKIIQNKSIRVFERKTVSDFVSSLSDDRFFSDGGQLERLSELGYGGIVVIGDYKSEVARLQRQRHCPYLFSRCAGALTSIMLRYWIPVFFFVNEIDFINYIKEKLLDRMEFKLRGRKLPEKNKDSRLNVMALYVKRLVMSELLNKFGNINNILNASDKEILEVKGCGKSTLEKIKEFKADLIKI